MKNKDPVQHSMTLLAAACVAAIALLAGCSSGGGGSGANPQPSGGNSDTPVTRPPAAAADTTPTAKGAEGTGNTVTAAGNAVSQMGEQVQEAPLPLLPAQARYGAGGLLVNGGEAVGALGAGVSNGLGQMGSVDNPVGVTVSSTGNVVQEVAEVVISAGQLVQGLGTGKLSPLAPVTSPLGTAVEKVGSGLGRGGARLSGALSEGPVAQVTDSASKVIVPLTSKATDGTQTLGAATHLGEPANGLLYKVGNTVATGGSMLSNSQAPVVAPLGGVVTETGRTVAAAGALLHGSGDGKGANPLGGVLSNLPMAGQANAQAGAQGGAEGGAGGTLAPLTSLLAPVTGLAGGIKNGGNGGTGGQGGEGKTLRLPLVGGLVH